MTEIAATPELRQELQQATTYGLLRTFALLTHQLRSLREVGDARHAEVLAMRSAVEAEIIRRADGIGATE